MHRLLPRRRKTLRILSKIIITFLSLHSYYHIRYFVIFIYKKKMVGIKYIIIIKNVNDHMCVSDWST